MTEQEMKEIIDGYVAAYNAFDLDRLMTFFHRDIAFTNYAGDQVTAKAEGIDRFRELAELGGSLFASRSQVVDELTFGENTAKAVISFDGELAADLPNGMKAGHVLHFDGRSEFEFRDGLIWRLADFI